MKFCVIGLGYVGLTLAVHLVRNGFDVDGVDISDTVIQSLSNGHAHFYEKNFDAEVKKAIDSGRFRFGKSIMPNDNETVVYIVTVGTPLGKNGRVNLEPIKNVSESISRVLHDNDYVIIRSTVRLGVTRNVVKPILDTSCKRYFLGFCPERTIEGKALEELENLPQIVSGIDELSAVRLNEIFSKVSRETVVMKSVEEAEMVKLLNNSERDLMFALANEIALMCDAKGINAHRVINAANYNYPRSNLKRPGPVGGPCLEKDPYILTESYLDESYVPKLFLAGREVNERIIADTFDAFADIFYQRFACEPRTVAILGMAFKGVPPTGDMRGSLVYKLIDTIKSRYPNVLLKGHDYLATLSDIQAAQCEPYSEVAPAVAEANMVILQNNHPNYASEPWEELLPKGALVLDFWNQLSSDVINRERYFSFGSLHAKV